MPGRGVQIIGNSVYDREQIQRGYMRTHPDMDVKDFSLQIDGTRQQADTTACFIDAKNTVVT